MHIQRGRNDFILIFFSYLRCHAGILGRNTMTELSFLIELILDDEMPKPLKGKIKDRIKEIEITPVHNYASPRVVQDIHPVHTAQAGQSASTLARLQDVPLPFPEPVAP